ncbi:hypothetical protein [Azohydromonas australica]|uniref:hypothetical protein n=1 Tax=Azohydromonas australica TaxID=364039 RepID=UPI00041865C6|nr:hypothetical protein [Azohydromonas australica]
MKVTAIPHTEAAAPVESVPVPGGVSNLQATDSLSVKTAAALLAVHPGAASGVVELSPLGQSVATLSAFGLPVALLPTDGPQDALLPGQQHHQQAAQNVIHALAAALSLKQAVAAEQWLGEEPESHAPAREHMPRQASVADAGAPARSPAQQSAGSLLNAMLCASLTGQTAIEVRRWDRRPLKLELQREPDGRGGFRVVRARVRHETEQGTLDAVVELSTSFSEDGETSAMNVNILCGEGLVREVDEHVDELRQALGARGLHAAVRALPAPAEA